MGDELTERSVGSVVMAPQVVRRHPDGSANEVRRLFARSVAYVFGAFAYKAVALLSVPVLARLLTPAEFGLLDTAGAVGLFLGTIALLGSDDAVARHQQAEADGRLWSSALMVVALGMLPTLGIAAALIALFTPDSLADARLAALAGVAYGAGVATGGVALNAVRLRGSPVAYAAVSFVVVTIQMASALVLAWAVENPVVWILGAWSAISLLSAAALLRRFLPRLGRPDREVIRRLLIYGLPLVPAAASWTVGDVGIRTVLGIASLPELGAYGIASRMVSVLGLLVAGFSLAWSPLIYRLSAPAIPEVARETLVQLILGLGAIALALSSLSPELVSLIAGREYGAAASGVAPMAAGMLGLGAVGYSAALLGLRQRTLLVGAASFMGAMVQILASVILVEDYGVAGAGLASFLGYALAGSAMLFFASQSTGIALLTRRLLLVVALLAIGMLVLSALDEAALLIRISSAVLSLAGATLAYRVGRE